MTPIGIGWVAGHYMAVQMGDEVAKHGEVELGRLADSRERLPDLCDIFDPLSSFLRRQFVEFDSVATEDQDTISAIVGIVLQVNAARRQFRNDIFSMAVRA